MSLAAVSITPGVDYFPGFLDRAAQEALRDEVLAILKLAPPFRPRMPRTGKPFSVVMSNCGPLGWVSDESAAIATSRRTRRPGAPWPAMPPRRCSQLSREVLRTAPPPEACLINLTTPTARMGLHQDRDEAALRARGLGLARGRGLFRVGGFRRAARPALPARYAATRVVCAARAGCASTASTASSPATSTLLPEGGRINLTLRRVTKASA